MHPALQGAAKAATATSFCSYAEAELGGDAYDATHRQGSIEDCLQPQPVVSATAPPATATHTSPADALESATDSKASKPASSHAVSPAVPGDSTRDGSSDDAEEK